MKKIYFLGCFFIFIQLFELNCIDKKSEKLRVISNEKLTNEILMAHVFSDSIRDVSWIQNRSFSPHGSAANYSFLYILFRILDDFNPSSIIEFGMGQSTKLTSQYAAYKNTKSRLRIVENDLNWIEIFKKFIPDVENIKILNVPVEERIFKMHKTTGYKDLKSVLGDDKFDLVIVDGPLGRSHFSRISVLDLLSKNLSDTFVILLDDCDRIGEQETVEEIKKTLDKNKIEYGIAYYSGTKDQIIIYSKKLNFLKSI